MCPFISVNNPSDTQFRCIAPAAVCFWLSGISCIIRHLQQEHSSASFKTQKNIKIKKALTISLITIWNCVYPLPQNKIFWNRHRGRSNWRKEARYLARSVPYEIITDQTGGFPPIDSISPPKQVNLPGPNSMGFLQLWLFILFIPFLAILIWQFLETMIQYESAPYITISSLQRNPACHQLYKTQDI